MLDAAAKQWENLAHSYPSIPGYRHKRATAWWEPGRLRADEPPSEPKREPSLPRPAAAGNDYQMPPRPAVRAVWPDPGSDPVRMRVRSSRVPALPGTTCTSMRLSRSWMRRSPTIGHQS